MSQLLSTHRSLGLLSKTKPISVEFGFGLGEAGAQHDCEGRLITAEFPGYFLVTAYVPNAGRGLVTLPKRLHWDPLFRQHLVNLDKKKPVIVCGDLNVAHKEIDLKNPKTNKKNAGFTQEERDGFTELLEAGFVDTFRWWWQQLAMLPSTHFSDISNRRRRTPSRSGRT
jgi:exodeoxyribonuclease III